MNILLLIMGILANIAHANNSIHLIDSTLNYLITVPEDFVDNIWPPSIGSSGNAVDHMTKNVYDFKDEKSVRIEVYNSPQYLCNDASLGTEQSQSIITNGNKAIWSFNKIYHAFDSFPETNCTLGTEKCEEGTSMFSGDCKTDNATYSFCAEKGEKTVAICIHQETKNESLAKQIFESFRWLEPTDIFVDVPITHPNATAVAYVKKQNIVQGYEDSTFKPNNTINRAEFTKIIMGAVKSSVMVSSDEPSDDCTMTLTDVVQGSWYEPFVTKAFCNNIINGYPDATFKPANTINAAEMYKIVANAFGLPTVAPTQSDEGWYTPYEYALQSIDAIPASITSADHLVTRGEMAEVVYRVMQAQK